MHNYIQTRPVHGADGGDGVSSHPIHDVDHVYDSLVSPPPTTKTKKTSVRYNNGVCVCIILFLYHFLQSSMHPYESVSLERDDQRKKSNQVEYTEIDIASLEKTADSTLTSTGETQSKFV